MSRNIKFLLVLSILLFLNLLLNLNLCKFENENENNYYRSGIITEESIRLDNDYILMKNEYVQIKLNKSTEEGIFVVTKNDSGSIYYQYVKVLCWLKKEKKIKEKDKTIVLKSNEPLITEDHEGDKIIVKYKDSLIVLFYNEIYYDNKFFFKRIIEDK